MAKINYSDGEKQIDEAVRRAEIQNLIKETEKDSSNPKKEKKGSNIKFLQALERDLILVKADEKMGKLQKKSEKKLKGFIKDPSKMNNDDWAWIKKVSVEVVKFKATKGGDLEKTFNEEQIEQQLEEHFEKYHKVKKGWKKI